MLVAQIDDLVLDQRRFERLERLGVETFFQIETVNLGAEVAPDALDLEWRGAVF